MPLSISQYFLYNHIIMKIFPETIPVFPLSGVIYFPKTNLPLNIFEKRYLDLINDIINKDKLMGMVQSKRKGQEVFKIGCLGKISDFQKSKDGRIIINLSGITRFEIIKEINSSKLYREFKVDYKKFNSDLKPIVGEFSIDNLIKKVKIFFKRSGLLLNWSEFEKLDRKQKINTLAMIAPITNEEKQKLIESVSLKNIGENLENIIDFYLHEKNFDNYTIQ